MRHFLLTAIMLSVTVFALSSCSSANKENDGGTAQYPVDPDDARRAKHGKLTGEGLKLWGSSDDEDKGGSGIGVNSFLWRATLDTISFIPLSTVDPHGGVIITDWYEDPQTRGERFKINAFILGTQLRTDGIRVSVFRQVKTANGWQDAEVSNDMARKLEDQILVKARELRITSSKRK